jgi:hypothetical protein
VLSCASWCQLQREPLGQVVEFTGYLEPTS